jgi:hypothetical protein
MGLGVAEHALVIRGSTNVQPYSGCRSSQAVVLEWLRSVEETEEPVNDHWKNHTTQTTPCTLAPSGTVYAREHADPRGDHWKDCHSAYACCRSVFDLHILLSSTLLPINSWFDWQTHVRYPKRRARQIMIEHGLRLRKTDP